jgi:UDP-GlcNAc:undecaprenyl-phosphate GlcNAc-1-phosphate transferase
VVGVLDDCLALPALPKFFAQIAAATIVVMHGCEIRYVTNPFSVVPFDLGRLAGPVTVFWIVLMTNAVNFIDGLDGLAVGVSGISTATMLVIALLLGEESVAVVLAALLGACIGFIPYNFNPAQIFMGDTGSTFLGFVLASISVQGLFKMYAVISFMVPFLILGVPFFDVSFAVIRRLAKGQNPMTADRGHIHHRLIDMGLSQKQSVAIVYMLTGVLGLAAVLLANNTGTKAFILFAAVFVVAVLGFAVIFGPHHRPPQKEEDHKEENHG